MTLTPRRSDARASAERRLLCEVRDIDPASRTDTAWAAKLHRELFAQIGMIAQLGPQVLQRFCYGRLIEDGLMRAALALVDGRPAGLIAFTTDSRAVHRATVGSHFLVALREVVIATIRSPRVALGFPRAARLIWERRNERFAEGTPVAEAMAFGVRADYRSHEFLRATGIRVSDRLLHHALRSLKSCGVRRVRGVILARNQAAAAFARKCGASVEPYHNAAEPSMEVWFDIDRTLSVLDHRAGSETSDSPSH